MRIISAVFFTILLNIAPACAEWVNVQDIKEPIRLLDTGSIKKVDYKNNEGAIFALRYMDKNNKESVATFFADFKNNKAGVISIRPYIKNMKYDFIIPDNFEMKNISEFKTNFSEIQKYVNGKMAETKTSESSTNAYLKEESNLEKIDKEGQKAENPVVESNAPYWKPYMTGLEKRIKKNWHPPKVNSSKRTVVLFKISKNGTFFDYKIVISSNNKLADEAALRAIKMASPFEAFPKKSKSESIDVEFTFDYNVINKGSFSPKVSPNNTWHGKYLKGSPI